MKSISIPFSFTGGKVGSTRNPDSVIRQKIVDVLVTSPLERLGLTNYGANIYSLVFEDIDELVASDFRLDAIVEVQNRVSGVTINDIRVKQNEFNPNTAEITVYYSLPLSSTQVFSFTVSDVLNEESPL